MRRFAKDAVLYSLPTFVARAVGILLLPIYARHLGPTNLGFIEYVAAMAVFALLLIPLEINQAMARLLPEDEDPVRRKAIIYSTITFTGWAFLVASVAGYIARRQIFEIAGVPFEYLGYTPHVLVYLSTLAVVSTLQVQFRYLQNATAAVTMNIAIIIINLALMLILAVNGLTISDYFISQISSNFIGVLLATGFLVRRFGRLWIFPNLTVTREMLNYSSPIVISSFGVALALGLDRILVGKYSGLTELGYYGVAAKFGAIAAMAFSVASSAMTPIVYRSHSSVETRNMVRNLFHATVCVCLLLMVAITFFSSQMVILVAGRQFEQSSNFVYFLIVSATLSNMYIFFMGMDIAKETRLIGKINFSMGITSAVLSLSLIPLFGVWGAIASALVAASLRLGLYIYYSQKLYRLEVALMAPFVAFAALTIVNVAKLS